MAALLKFQRSVMNIKKGGLRILVFQNLTLTLVAVLILQKGSQSAMFSRIVAIVFAVSCIFVVNASVIRPANTRVLEPVLACTQTANSAAMAYEKAMEGHRDTDADDMKLSCLSTEVRSAAS